MKSFLILYFVLTIIIVNAERNCVCTNEIIHQSISVNSIESDEPMITMCSNTVNVEKQQAYVTFANSLAAFLNSYDELPNTADTFSCQSNLRMLLANATKLVEKKMTKIGNDMHIDMKHWIPIGIDAVDAIRKEDFAFARYKLLENGNLDLSTLIPKIYAGNLTYALKVVKFLNSFPDTDDTIYGYRILLDEMKKNGHLYSTVTTMIAYQVLNILHTSKNENEHFMYVRDHLPTSYTTFKWNRLVSIHNTVSNEIYYSSDDYDTSRKFLYTYITDFEGTQRQWIFEPESNGEYFNIKNNRHNFYLYADTKDFAFDNQRRRVFLWRTANKAREMGRWQFEPIEGSDYFKVKNLYWNEYLYLDSKEYRYDPSYGNVYSWIPGGCIHEGCKWKFTKV